MKLIIDYLNEGRRVNKRAVKKYEKKHTALQPTYLGRAEAYEFVQRAYSSTKDLEKLFSMIEIAIKYHEETSIEALGDNWAMCYHIAIYEELEEIRTNLS